MYSKEPLAPGTYFQVKIEQLDVRWTGSLMIGLTGQPVEKISSPTSALLIKRQTWIICGNAIHQDGRKICSNLSFDLNELLVGQSVGVYLHSTGYLHVLIDGVDQGSVLWIGKDGLHAVVDLYGMCVQVSTLTGRPTPATADSQHPPGIEEKALLENSSTEKCSYQVESSVVLRSSCRYR